MRLAVICTGAGGGAGGGCAASGAASAAPSGGLHSGGAAPSSASAKGPPNHTTRACTRSLPILLPSVAIASGYQTLRWLPSRTFVVPRLEAEQVPQEQAVVAPAREVLRPDLAHRLGIE